MQELLSLPQKKRKFGGDFMDWLGECYRLKYTGHAKHEHVITVAHNVAYSCTFVACQARLWAYNSFVDWL